jgi:hypothetical protein
MNEEKKATAPAWIKANMAINASRDLQNKFIDFCASLPASAQQPQNLKEFIIYLLNNTGSDSDTIAQLAEANRINAILNESTNSQAAEITALKSKINALTAAKTITTTTAPAAAIIAAKGAKTLPETPPPPALKVKAAASPFIFNYLDHID